MFTHLLDLSYRRSAKEALGFYLFYFVILVGVSAVAGAIFGAATPDRPQGFAAGYQSGLAIGNVVAIVGSAGLSFVVLVQKGRFNHPGYLLVGLLGVAGAFAAGALLGMIAPSWLSTRPSTAEAAAARGG